MLQYNQPLNFQLELILRHTHTHTLNSNNFRKYCFMWCNYIQMQFRGLSRGEILHIATYEKATALFLLIFGRKIARGLRGFPHLMSHSGAP